jgi:hypothetical protein
VALTAVGLRNLGARGQSQANRLVEVKVAKTESGANRRQKGDASLGTDARQGRLEELLRKG